MLFTDGNFLLFLGFFTVAFLLLNIYTHRRTHMKHHDPSEEKSHVAMGYTTCPVCDKETDRAVVLDKRLRNSLPRRVQTGLELCDEHGDRKAEFITLIAVDSDPNDNEGAMRTGELVHVKWEFAQEMFPIDARVRELGFAFITGEILETFRQLHAQAEGDDHVKH